MGLITDLNTELNDVYMDDNGAWRQFVIDHLAYIQANASRVYPDATVMQKYRYDVKRYMLYNTTLASMGWIFLLVNGLSSERDFTESQIYYLPDYSYIDELYHTYLTTSQTS